LLAQPRARVSARHLVRRVHLRAEEVSGGADVRG
jgi:hypothetical protein